MVGTHTVTVTPPGGGSAVDLSCIIDTVTINHGRDDPNGQPEASSVTVDFTATPDAPLPAAVEIGATIDVVTTTTVAHPRFHGRVTDLVVGWEDAGQQTPDRGVGQLVAVGILADLGRRVVGDAPFPQELDGARVARVLNLAGITLDPADSDPGTVQILPRDIDSQPALDVAQGTAQSARGVVWETRDGTVHYADAEHRRGTQVTLALDACQILVTPSWRRTIAGLVNQVSIGYGPTPDGGEQPRYIADRPESVAKYGRYNYTTTTELAEQADAAAMGELLLVRNSSPVWVMADLPVDVESLTADEYDTLLDLDMHSLVNLTGLPTIGSAPSSAVLWVEGWKETLTYGGHEIDLVVSGYCRTVPAPQWDNVDPAWVWGGEALTEQARNLITNPSFEINTTNWVAARGTIAVVTPPAPAAPSGSAACAYTSTDSSIANGGGNYMYHSPTLLLVTPGEAYAFAVMFRPAVPEAAGPGTAAVWLQWWDAAGVYINSSPTGPRVTPAVGAWSRLTCTGTAPANAAKVSTHIVPAGTPPLGVVAYWVDAAILTHTPTPQRYFDGDTPDYDGAVYAWTGTPHLSASTLTGRRVLARNLATNPGAEAGALNWNSNNGAYWVNTLDSTVARSGARSVRSTPQAAAYGTTLTLMSMYNVGGGVFRANPGEVFTASVWLRHNSTAPMQGGRVGYQFLDAGNALIGGTTYCPYTPMPVDTWVRAVVTTIPAPAGTVSIRLLNSVEKAQGANQVVAGELAWADDALLVLGTTAPDYFDGDTPDTESLAYAWTGTPRASESVSQGLALTPGGVDPSWTWDDMACFGPPASLGRWSDVPASMRWDTVTPASVTWDTWKD